jgi:hypothetical protein
MLQIIHLQLSHLIKPPFFGHANGQLHNLDIVERLFQNHEPFEISERSHHLFPRIIGVGRAEDHL